VSGCPSLTGRAFLHPHLLGDGDPPGYHYSAGPYVEYEGVLPEAAKAELPELLTDQLRAIVAEEIDTEVRTNLEVVKGACGRPWREASC
jgi:hypothetical protein